MVTRRIDSQSFGWVKVWYGRKRDLQKYVEENPKSFYEAKEYGLVERPVVRRMHLNNKLAEWSTGGRISKRGS